MDGKYVTEGLGPSAHVVHYVRHIDENESYVNRMLTEINTILARNGGQVLNVLPKMGMIIDQGKEGEESIYFCDGMTFKNGFNPQLRSEVITPNFWTLVYTPRTDWEDAKVIQELEKFYRVENLGQVSNLEAPTGQVLGDTIDNRLE